MSQAAFLILDKNVIISINSTGYIYYTSLVLFYLECAKGVLRSIFGRATIRSSFLDLLLRVYDTWKVFSIMLSSKSLIRQSCLSGGPNLFGVNSDFF